MENIEKNKTIEILQNAYNNQIRKIRFYVVTSLIRLSDTVEYEENDFCYNMKYELSDIEYDYDKVLRLIEERDDIEDNIENIKKIEYYKEEMKDWLSFEQNKIIEQYITQLQLNNF